MIVAPETPLEWAHWYRSHGISVFPCRPRDKRPLIDSWLHYQTELPVADELDVWFSECPDANLAVVTGRGLLVVDLDGVGAEDLLYAQTGVALPDHAPRVRTGNGEHVYLSVDRPVANKAGIVAAPGGKPAVDVRGDGGYVLAPPSIHPSGAAYAWSREWDGEPLPPAPERLLALLSPAKGTPAGTPPQNGLIVRAGEEWFSRIWRDGAPQGQRNQTCARMAGLLLKHQLPADMVESILGDWAQRCHPPMAIREVETVVRSVSQREASRAVTEGESTTHVPTAEPLSQVVAKVIAVAKAGPAKSVVTGFPGLNRILSGGFYPGELIYLGARPGVGKTALALECARAAGKAGNVTILDSREMSAIALGRRMMAQQGQFPARQLKTGHIADWNPIVAAAKQLEGFPIWISDNAFTVEDIRTVMAGIGHAVDFVIVDYLQLLRARPGINERRFQVEDISQSLKALAMQCKIPVLCLSALARPAEGKERRPRMSDLRESSALEHDADVIMFLHREKDSESVSCIVEKNRDGETGELELVFRPEFVSFGEQTAEWELPPEGRDWHDA